MTVVHHPALVVVFLEVVALDPPVAVAAVALDQVEAVLDS
jgi:hypothetical protein